MRENTMFIKRTVLLKLRDTKTSVALLLDVKESADVKKTIMEVKNLVDVQSFF